MQTPLRCTLQTDLLLVDETGAPTLTQIGREVPAGASIDAYMAAEILPSGKLYDPVASGIVNIAVVNAHTLHPLFAKADDIRCSLPRSETASTGQASATSALGSLAPAAAAATAAVATSTDPFGAVDLTRLAIQKDLYNTQFYKGRTDGRLGDEDRMTAAISLVQIRAGLPVTGIYDDAVHRAIAAFVSSHGQSWSGFSPSPFPLPSPTSPTTSHVPTPIGVPIGQGKPKRSLAVGIAAALALAAIVAYLEWKGHAAETTRSRRARQTGKRP